MRPVRAVLSVLAFLSALSAAAAIAAPAAPAAPLSDEVIRRKIVGNWGQSPTCREGRLIFSGDGSFESRSAQESQSFAGTYTIDRGRLIGHNGDNDMPDALVDFDGEALLLDDGGGNPQRLTRCATAR